jgi:hypothetical protein
MLVPQWWSLISGLDYMGTGKFYGVYDMTWAFLPAGFVQRLRRRFVRWPE